MTAALLTLVRRIGLIATGVLVATGLSGCSTIRGAVPSCTSVERLAIVAQSIPESSYVPCIGTLAQGWTATGFEPARGRTRFHLTSDRAPGHPVRVSLVPACDVTGATPTTPRGEGVRTYSRLRSITPRYAGTLFDVFPGGCVSYDFDFPRGPHIGLMEDFESAVSLMPRQQLRLDVRRKLGLELNQ